MNILIYSDNHFCQNSSIIRGRGNKFSDRLENQIQTLQFIEKTAIENGCQAIFNCGDFFDKPELNSEEISALKEVGWNRGIPHYYIVGNHDASDKALSFNSTNALASVHNSFVVDSSCFIELDGSFIAMLPYESLDADEYIDAEVMFSHAVKDAKYKNRILLSHNEIKGLQYGKYVSDHGLDIDSVCSVFDFCVNGHLHNTALVNEKILNVGNVTGQNFSEDAFVYKHGCIILNTDDLTYKFIENPFAFKFYKIDGDNYGIISTLGTNSVLAVTCSDDNLDYVKGLIDSNKNIKYKKIIVQKSASISTEDRFFSNNKTPENKFSDFVLKTLGDSDVVRDEIIAICGG